MVEVEGRDPSGCASTLLFVRVPNKDLINSIARLTGTKVGAVRRGSRFLFINAITYFLLWGLKRMCLNWLNTARTASRDTGYRGVLRRRTHGCYTSKRPG